MKKGLFKAKSRRTKIFTAITLLSVVSIFALNMLLYYFGIQNTLFLDMTPEGLYSLSDAMVEECDEMFDDIKASGEGSGKKVKVLFCTDEDYLIASEKTRLTYFMALKLQKRYSDTFEVDAENVIINPTAFAKYKTTSLSKINSNHVIVSYGDRYRIVSADYFWATGSSEAQYYNGEYRIASLIKSVTSISKPVAYFLAEKGATYYDPNNKDSEMSRETEVFAALLAERGLEIKPLYLSTVDRVPEDCALLIINNPREDFTYDEDRLDEFSYVTDIEKLDRYLVMKQGAIAVAKDYEISLPIFESFLYEWGFDFSDSIVVDRESSLEDSENTGTNLIAKYDTDEESYGYALYGEYATLSSAPLMVFSNSGSVGCSFKESLSAQESGAGFASRNYAPFLTTSDSAQRYMKNKDTGEITSYIDGPMGKYDLAAVTVRREIDSISAVYSYSYLFCANSADFFSSSLLGEVSFANYDIISAVVENISRVDEHASMDLGALSFNSASSAGKFIIPTTMSEEDQIIYSNKYVDNDVKKPRIIIKETNGISKAAIGVYTVVIMIVPTAVGILGAVILIKRRFL